MKKVYTIVLAAALMLLGTQAKAQLNIGVGYLNSTEITTTTSNNNELSRMGLNGLFLGASYNIEIVNGFGVAPGFYVDVLFAEYNRAIYAYSDRRTKRKVDLNVPINLTYRYEVNDKFAILVYAGPVFQYGVSYKYNWYPKTEGIINISGAESYNMYDKDQENKIIVLSEGKERIYNPFNIYLGGGAGVQLGDIQIHVGYDHSLLNCARTDGYNTRRSQIKVGVNFEF